MKGKNNSIAKRVLAWICIAVAVFFTTYAFVAKHNHWPGANLTLLLIPVWVMLVVIGIVILIAANKKHIYNDSTLAVDYRVRYLIGKTMRAKRRVAWMIVAAGIIAVLCALVRLVFFDNYDFPVVLFILPAAVSLLTIGLTTIHISKKVDAALDTDDQSLFDKAMEKWAFRCRLMNWGAMLAAAVTLILVIIVQP